MSGLAGLSRGTRVPICPGAFCVPWDRDRDRSLRDERDRDKFSRDCPVPSLVHPGGKTTLTLYPFLKIFACEQVSTIF